MTFDEQEEGDAGDDVLKNIPIFYKFLSKFRVNLVSHFSKFSSDSDNRMHKLRNWSRYRSTLFI